jgi:hypothetical protein
VAVFPGFISLKNSTDPEAVIVTAIETGGTDEINQGELVIGLSAGDATLFTKDSLGDIVTISGSGGGAVDSVNTQTGVVSLGIVDLDDFELNPANSQRTWIYSTSSLTNPATGLISNWTGTAWMVNITDKDGADASAMQSASGVQSVTVYIDGVSTYVGTITSWASQNNDRTGFQFADDSWKSSLTGGEEITLDMAIFATGDTPLADGDILQYVSVDSKFKPLQQTGSTIRTLLGIGEYADDAAAGTGGVSSGALYYNTTNSNYVLKA